MNKKRLLIVLFAIFPLVVGLACLGSKPDPTATPTEEVVIEPTEEATEETTEEVVPTEEPTEEAAPTEESGGGESTGTDLVMLEKNKWIYDEESNVVFVAFFFENPTEMVYEDVEYTVYLVDADGNEVDNQSASIRYIFPQQVFGIAFNFYLDDEAPLVDSASVDWEYDDRYIDEDLTNPFSTDSILFWENDGWPMVTGKVVNTNTNTYSDIRANIICYDDAGDIVGGGYTYIDFVPGEFYSGFSTYVDAYSNVASVEVFPTLSYLSERYEGNDFWSYIDVTDTYFYEGDYDDIQFGAVIQNTTDRTIKDAIVVATFYDDDDNITAVGESYVDVLLPGSTLGVYPWVSSPPDGTVTTKYDVIVLPGDFDDDYELTENPFTVNDAQITGDYDENVTVSFTNNYSKSVSEVDVYVLLYDAEGKIIGGGDDWSEEPTPAGGTTEVEVWVDYSDDRAVDDIKVWVVPNYWTEFE
jgi:hypothetical protein